MGIHYTQNFVRLAPFLIREDGRFVCKLIRSDSFCPIINDIIKYFIYKTTKKLIKFNYLKMSKLWGMIGTTK